MEGPRRVREHPQGVADWLESTFVIVTCGYCVRQFEVRPRALRHGRGKFCSRDCQYASRRGVQNLADFKGDAAAYSTVHGWVSRNWGKAARCENESCAGQSQYFEWANLNGDYRRIREEWAQLCRPCHRRFDLDHDLIRRRPSKR